jgi:phosphatidylserine synthase
MIQRKQSIFLLLSVLVFIATYYFSFGSFGNNTLATYRVSDASGAEVSNINTYFFGVPFSLAATLTLVSMFMYKSLQRQMAMIRFTFILFTISAVLLVFYIRSASVVLNGENFTPGISFFLLFVCIFLNMYALRLIRKDDKLLKSVDRIR